MVSVSGDAQRSVSYGELLGERRFDLTVSGSAPLKPRQQYRLVGTSLPRTDIPEKASGRYVYMQHVRLPGMLHGRVVRPRGQGALGVTPKVRTLDEGSIRGIAARVVRRGDFIGVVAAREWDAVRAASQLAVTWDRAATLPGNDNLHAQMRSQPTQDRVVLERGDCAAAFAAAPHVAAQVARGPYQAHAAFAPQLRRRRRAGGRRARHLDDPGYLRHPRHARAPARPPRREGPGPLPGGGQQLRARVPGRRDAGGGDHVATRRRAPCACSSCARTSMAGTTSARRTSAKCVPRPTQTAASSRTSITAGSTTGPTSNPRPNWPAPHRQNGKAPPRSRSAR